MCIRDRLWEKGRNWDVEGVQCHWHPDDDAAKSAAATRARDPALIIHSRTGRPRKCAHRHDVGAPKAGSTTHTLMKTPARSRSRCERGIRFQTFLLGLRKAGCENKLETRRRIFQMDDFAHISDQRQPQPVTSQRTHAEPTWAEKFAKILRRLDRAWAAALRALTTLRLSYP